MALSSFVGTAKTAEPVSCVAGIAASAKGATIGATVGSVLGPVGSAVGGFVGGTIGYIAGSKLGQLVTKGFQKVRSVARETIKSIGGAIKSKAKSALKAVGRFLGF